MVEAIVRTPLGIHRLRIVGKAAIGHGRRVYHSHHSIHGKRIAQTWPLKRLHQRLGQCQARSFDHQMINLLAPCGELLHHRRELFLHGAAQAAIGQLKQLAVIRAAFIAPQAATAQQFAINAQFAKFVHDHGDALALGMAQDLAQQRGFARTQKSGDDGGGYLLQIHGVFLYRASNQIRLQSSMPRCAGMPAAKWCLTNVISVTVSAYAVSSSGA